MVSNGSAGNQRRIRQTFNPVAKCMPFIELVMPTGFVDIGQNLIVQHDRPFLIVRARKKLDHLPPNILGGEAGIFLSLRRYKIFSPVIIEDVNCQVKKLKSSAPNMRSVVYSKLATALC